MDVASSSILNDGPLVAMRSGAWCCLLCERQFKSTEHLERHLTKSALHRDNVAAASSAGRLTGPAASSSLPPRPAPEASDEPPAKRKPPPEEEAPPAAPEKKGGAISALEAMELFEKRLKSQAKHQPEKPRDEMAAVDRHDSSKARTINNQMDWECGQCQQFNFARSVHCHACNHHVDANTKYLTNRLKELKQERFARVFGAMSRDGAPGGGPTPGFVQDPAKEHAHQRAKQTADNNCGGAMLASMGWKGGGLGASEQGRHEPVRASGASSAEGDRRAAFHM